MIVSACCGAKLKWRKRREGRTVFFENPIGGPGAKKIPVHIKGPRLHAYVCDDCGKPDR